MSNTIQGIRKVFEKCFLVIDVSLFGNSICLYIHYRSIPSLKPCCSCTYSVKKQAPNLANIALHILLSSIATPLLMLMV